MTSENVDYALKYFVENEFPYVLLYDGYKEYTRLEESLKTVILSDRYNKEEEIIEGLEFDIVRKVLYNFNTRHLLSFFSQKSYSLLFFHYFDYHAKKEVYQQHDVDSDGLYREMSGLYKEADKYVRITADNYKKDVVFPEQQKIAK